MPFDPKAYVEVFAVPGALSVVDPVNPETGNGLYSGKTFKELREEHPTLERYDFDVWRTTMGRVQNPEIRWEPTTEERYHEMLEVLPPREWQLGLFLVGEPVDHSIATGQPRYECYRKSGSTYWVSSRPITLVEFRKAVEDKRASL